MRLVGPRTDHCPGDPRRGGEADPAPAGAPPGSPRGAVGSSRGGRGRLSTWRLAPAWPGPRGRAASPAPSPPLSQPLTPRPGRDCFPTPPLAARGNTLAFPPPWSILQGTRACSHSRLWDFLPLHSAPTVAPLLHAFGDPLISPANSCSALPRPRGPTAPALAALVGA